MARQSLKGFGVVVPTGEHFCAAERAVEYAVEGIIEQSQKLLEQRRLRRACYPFATQAVANYCSSELRLRFIRHDEGEPPEDAELWEVEPEPMPPVIDNWGGRAVPKLKKSARAQSSTAQSPSHRGRWRTSRQNSKQSLVPPMSRESSVCSRGSSSSHSPLAVTTRAARARTFPITEDIEEDEEERLIREMKENEEQRQREAEQRRQRLSLQRRAEEEAAMLERKANKGKLVSYDSKGNLILVEPPSSEMLPELVPSPDCKVRVRKKGRLTASFRGDQEWRQSLISLDENNDVNTAKPRKKASHPELMATKMVYKKLEHQQPLMMDAMEMAPGVELAERGRSKKEGDYDPKKSEAGKMSRKDYDKMVRIEAGEYSSSEDEGSIVFPRSEAAASSSDIPPPRPPPGPMPAQAAKVPEPSSPQSALTPSQTSKRHGLGVREQKANDGLRLRVSQSLPMLPPPPRQPVPADLMCQRICAWPRLKIGGDANFLRGKPRVAGLPRLPRGQRP